MGRSFSWGAVATVVLVLALSCYVGQADLVGQDLDGGFANLGSLCFPAATKSQVKIQYSVPSTAAAASQLLLFYDDQEESYDRLSTTPGNCNVQEALSREICSGDKCTAGYTLKNTGSSQTYYIDINESRPRQWYFLASNCVKEDGNYVQKAVLISSYSISSPAAVDCASLYQDNTGGLVVAVVFLTLISLALMAVTYFLYRKTQSLGPSLLGAGGTTYNDL